MCLERLKDFRTIGNEGYKIFRMRAGKLSPLCAGKRDKPLLRGRWLKAKDWHEKIVPRRTQIWDIEGKTCSTYSIGWHIFMSKREARTWCDRMTDKIFKVKYRNISVKGTRDDNNIIVAQEMIILQEVQL